MFIFQQIFYHCLHRFPQESEIVLVHPENNLIYKFMQSQHGFILNWTFLKFLDFCEKILGVLGYSKSKIFSRQPWWQRFIWELGLPSILVVLRPCFYKLLLTVGSLWKNYLLVAVVSHHILTIRKTIFPWLILENYVINKKMSRNKTYIGSISEESIPLQSIIH